MNNYINKFTHFVLNIRRKKVKYIKIEFNVHSLNFQMMSLNGGHWDCNSTFGSIENNQPDWCKPNEH